MRGGLALCLVLGLGLVPASGCSPNADTGVGPGHDNGGTDTGDGAVDIPGGCNAADCTARCATAGYPGGSCTGSGACTCSSDDAGTPPSAFERCDDGLDNNGNGAVDEGCGGCALGESQPCYHGTAESRGIGLCEDGSQPCQGGGEFTHWGECIGDILPSEEVCDGLDNDCDLAVDEGCGECVPTELGGEIDCGNGLDDDCDTVVDCFDEADCPPCCRDEICGDGLDNNCDTQIDEFCDSPCAPIEFGPIVCDDGLDNDCDGRTDCTDLQCLPFCCSVEECTNGTDDDCDGAIDCDDTDCCTTAGCGTNPVCGSICCAPGTTRWCDTPSYCSWGIQDCRPDGRWGTCVETTERPAGCEETSYYYSTSCCVDLAVACCQNYGRYDPALPADASVGECEGVAVDCPA